MRPRKLQNISQNSFNFRDWGTPESLRNSKDSLTTSSFHNKSSSHISKYSVSRAVQMKKRLQTELKSHGDSIIYNFKCLESNISESPPLTESPKYMTPKLPNITSISLKPKRNYSKLQLTPKNRPNISSISLTKSQYIEPETSRTFTNQLEEKIKSYLRPKESSETECALKDYETEISTFRERYKQQNDFIHRVLKTRDEDDLDLRLKQLSTRNIVSTIMRKKIEDLDSDEAHKILQKAGITEEQLSLTNGPKFQPVGFRIKKYDKELNPDYHTINTFVPFAKDSENSQSPSTSPSKSRDYGLHQPSKTPRARLESKAYDFNKLTKKQLSSMVEGAKGALDTKLAPYKFVHKGPEGASVQKIASPRVSILKLQHPSRRYTERFSLFMKKWDRPMNHEIMRKFAHTIKVIVKKMLRLDLTIKEVTTQEIFPKGPLERKGAHLLINYAKKGDYKAAKDLLRKNQYLVYDYDNTYQTALHWAAKRGHNAVVKLLLEYRADPDALDISRRSPLFFAAKGHHLISLKLLLYNGASPLLKSVKGKLPVDYAGSDEIIKVFLRKAFRMHIVLGNCSGRVHVERWGRMDKTAFQVPEYEIDYIL